MADSANTRALYRARDRFNAHDDAYFELYAGDVVLHGFPAGVVDLRALERFYRAFWAEFPDAELDFEDVFEQGDRVAVRYRLRGTHHAANRIDVNGMAIMRMRDAAVVEHWQTLDDLGLVQQVGAIRARA